MTWNTLTFSQARVWITWWRRLKTAAEQDCVSVSSTVGYAFQTNCGKKVSYWYLNEQPAELLPETAFGVLLHSRSARKISFTVKINPICSTYYCTSENILVVLKYLNMECWLQPWSCCGNWDRYLRQVLQSLYVPPEQKDIWTTFGDLNAQNWSPYHYHWRKRLALHSETSWKAKATRFIPQLFNPGLYLL